MSQPPVKKNWRRTLRAQLRDARVLFKESRISLIAFGLVLLVGAAFFFWFYVDPNSGDRLDFFQALYATFAMVFFETVLDYPQNGFLRILFFVIPVAGLAAVADGVLRFGSALINKQNRGEKWQVAMASTFNGHIIVCGVGKVGYRVILELLKLGRDIVAIEADPNGRFVEKVTQLGIPLILANARRSENLRKANISQASAIIPCTDDELTNLDIALDALEMNPEIKIVMRMFDPDLARRVEKGFGIHSAFSTSALAAPVFAAAALDLSIKSSFYIGQDLLNLSELVVEAGSLLAGGTVQQLEMDLDLNVVFYQHGEITDLHPAPDRVLMVGTKLLVLASLDTLTRLKWMQAGGSRD